MGDQKSTEVSLEETGCCVKSSRRRVDVHHFPQEATCTTPPWRYIANMKIVRSTYSGAPFFL